MNGDVVREQIKEGFFSATSQIAGLASDDSRAVEAAYLAVLTRRPTPEESAHFAGRLAGTSGDDRKQRLSDLYWTWSTRRNSPGIIEALMTLTNGLATIVAASSSWPG